MKRLFENLFTRLILYYAALVALLLATQRMLPRLGVMSQESMDTLFGTGVPSAAVITSTATPAVGQMALAGTVGVAMIGAVLLALPVSWVYIMTRRRRGYSQSVVQTLMILPIIVAGIVVLVKYSVALAFSLAGIVAAVRFRNTLEDSKDAVYIFLATGLGLSAAVDIPVAIVISVIFNAVILALHYSDFGRTPAHFEGALAKKRMDKAMEAFSQTGSFVALLDKDVLHDMSPEQLEAIAERASKRRRELADTELGGGGDGKAGARLKVRTYDADAVRPRLELVLEEQLKAWELEKISGEPDGTHVMEYKVRLRKNVSQTAVLDTIRQRVAQHVVGVELD